MRRCATIAAGMLVASAVSVEAFEGEISSRPQARSRAEAHERERLLRATTCEIFSPLYSVDGDDETMLVALNTVNEPVTFDLAALNPAGDPLPLGRYSVDPSRHLTVALRDLIRPAGPDYRQGSLRVTFLGDTSTLQAWAVVRRGNQATEFAFQSPTEVAGSELTAFWDAARLPGKPTVYLLNAGDRPVRYDVVGPPAGVDRPGHSTIPPGARHTIAPQTERGSMRVHHDGEEGSLIAAAVIEGSAHLSRAGLIHGGVGVDKEFEAVSVPLDPQEDGSPAEALVTLFNGATETNRVRVTIVSPVTGQTVDETTHRLETGEVLSLPLHARLIGLLADPVSRDVRVRVTGQIPGLLVAGRSVLSGGETIDLSFFPVGDAHAAGSYPVFPLDQFDVQLTLANLDPEDSQVVAQFFWDGGTYAFGPVTVPGGTSYRLSVVEVVQRGEPDVLGRTLPSILPHGFLKWKVLSGSRRLLGRTEARLRESRDAFGFNCYGCCYEVPFGMIEPNFVEFEPGQSPLFQACIGYETCSGTMGPYPIIPGSLTAPSPFSWNGIHISASATAEADLSFLEFEDEYFSNCTVLERPVRGFGVGSACKPLLRKQHDQSKFWSNSQACTLQVGSEPSDKRCSRCIACCVAQRTYRLCRKQNAQIVEREYQVCLGLCQVDHCM